MDGLVGWLVRAIDDLKAEWTAWCKQEDDGYSAPANLKRLVRPFPVRGTVTDNIRDYNATGSRSGHSRLVVPHYQKSYSIIFSTRPLANRPAPA